MIGSPTAMPASATTIGSAMASTEPNAISKMTIAARMPMPSPEIEGRSDCWMSWPPSRTSSCGVEWFSASAMICRPTESGTSCDLPSSSAFASAIVPDFEIPPGAVYGSLTLATCGHRASAAMNACACCSTAGSCIDGVPCITTCTASPDCALKFAASRFDARVDSVFGALKFVEKFVPATEASTLTPIERREPEQHDQPPAPVTEAGERTERHAILRKGGNGPRLR